MRNRLIILAVLLTVSALSGYYLLVANANQSVLDKRWAHMDQSSDVVIDHSAWQTILDDYLVTDTESGVNLFDYEGLIDDGREPLDQYITQLASQDPLKLNRLEQKSYWLNLYNALTVQLIVANYPLSSITKLGSNVAKFGPWEDIAIELNGIELSLNDIEHRIIRPLYKDYRIHFAVNCASIGCPDLAATAFSAGNVERQLDDAASAYLNHPRGLRFEKETLHLSTLFKWYATDFGDNQSEVLATLGQHINSEVREALSNYNGSPTYAYDWSLNGYCSVDDECGE